MHLPKLLISIERSLLHNMGAKSKPGNHEIPRAADAATKELTADYADYADNKHLAPAQEILAKHNEIEL